MPYLVSSAGQHGFGLSYLKMCVLPKLIFRTLLNKPSKLKTPQVSQLKRPSKDEEEQSTRTDTSSVAISSIWIPSHLSTGPGQLELHPNPKHVFKLWQTFADRVNPLIKIVHAPTLQEKIFEAAWAVESATKPLEAMMFAVYALAVASMKPADCMQTFGESRPVLVSRYRTGALRALHSADLLLTRDLEVLQAFALTLVIPDLRSIAEW